MSTPGPAGGGTTLLVDSSSLIYRAYFAVPPTVRGDDGRPANAAYGFINMLARLIGDLRPAFIGCAWDDDWRPAWRVELIPAYKAHRVAATEEQPDEDLEAQFPVIAELLELAGVPSAGVEGYEAEDVIGELAGKAPGPVVIVSGDRDLFQLVRDPDVKVLYPKRGVSDLVVVDEAEIRRRYAIPGRVYADFAIIRGDPSDGLPGVRGIGEKTAAELIRKYGTLDGVLDAARDALHGPLAKIDAARDYLERAKRVVRIPCDVGLGVRVLTPRPPDPRTIPVAETRGVAGPAKRLLAALAGIAAGEARGAGEALGPG